RHVGRNLVVHACSATSISPSLTLSHSLQIHLPLALASRSHKRAANVVGLDTIRTTVLVLITVFNISALSLNNSFHS
ncbi:hypothetical protein BT69DRAFT_1291345, partial [Atractiella rhizophila]